ncbi:SDR family NAD(P)-dependent oxidoreductase [Levilactobacillus spicheri]|uniref:Short-chain dehydrogenase n=1 Tax=Levilactobacillus spicheri TaxID=216463 RepID=A0A0F3RT87_9LACO|nr:SDR family NAD(P)-dependent oxidoreductase [Levilactobacillus spicheri]KJW13206.1 Short-chain dehydrogenase [Levilactobacillus spicheri]
MTNFQQKYGQYAVILGAADGLGKQICYKLASLGLDIVCVDYSAEKINQFAATFPNDFPDRQLITLQADLSMDNVTDQIFRVTDAESVGFMSYVACLHQFGRLQETAWKDHQKMLNVNVINFLKCLHHYMGIFAKQSRGGVLNLSSLTGVTASPYNAQYGAGKAYIKSITQAAGYEAEKENIDVMVATLGATSTPTELENQPGGSVGAAIQKIAMTPEKTVNEIFEHFGQVHSYYVGEHPKAQVKKWKTELSEDDVAAYMGRFYE